MQAFLEYVVRGLVDHPAEIAVTPVEHTGLTTYQLRLHPEDVGRVVGRKGSTINAVRTLVQAGAAKKGRRAALEIIETPKPA